MLEFDTTLTSEEAPLGSSLTPSYSLGPQQ